MSGSEPSELRRFLGKNDYRGADMNISRQLTAFAMFVTAALLVVLSPLNPPDKTVGDAGWLALGLIALAYGLAGLRLTRLEHLRPSEALITHVACLVGVAFVVALCGGIGAAYVSLFLLWLTLGSAVHPPRRTLGIIGLTAVLTAAPLFYDKWSSVFIGEIGLRLFTWSIVGIVACFWATNVRSQRLDLIEEEERASRLARVDQLTGLRNRRAFDERIVRSIQRAEALKSPLSIIICDLDGFKEINDSYGHMSGDAALRDAAAAMQGVVRDHDACYRWGGDEFAFLLPGLDLNAAERVAERMSSTVVAACTRPDGEPLTMAWGTAELMPGMQVADLLTAADLALLTRKHSRGRGHRFPSQAETPDSEQA